MEGNIEHAWERLVEALFDAEPEERREALTEIEGYVKGLPATFTSWEEYEKEDDDGVHEG